MKRKGWKAEQEIDIWLNKIHNKEIKCSSRQGEYLLCDAKTCIQSLRKEIKNVESFYKILIDDLEFKIKYLELQNKEVFSDNKKLKEQSSLINQLQFDNDALSKIIEELRKENDKLKDDLSDCIHSNQLLEREYDRLMNELKERK